MPRDAPPPGDPLRPQVVRPERSNVSVDGNGPRDRSGRCRTASLERPEDLSAVIDEWCSAVESRPFVDYRARRVDPGHTTNGSGEATTAAALW